MGWGDKAKRFATAPLKEYPSHLCATLATIIMSGIDSPQKRGDVEVDVNHLEGFVRDTSHLYQLLGQCEPGSMQPDWFQG